MTDLVPFASSPIERPVVQIGDITVMPTTTYTPSGQVPTAEVQWNVTDMSRSDRYTPAWAIVFGIIGIVLGLLTIWILFFGLLLLIPGILVICLVRNNRQSGFVQVTAQGPGFFHSANIPVAYPLAVQDTFNRVNFARSVSAAQRGLR